MALSAMDAFRHALCLAERTLTFRHLTHILTSVDELEI